MVLATKRSIQFRGNSLPTFEQLWNAKRTDSNPFDSVRVAFEGPQLLRTDLSRRPEHQGPDKLIPHPD